MATLNIGGRKITVGDEFLSLPADQQSAAVEEISRSLEATPAQAPAANAPEAPVKAVPEPDKYLLAARKDREKLKTGGLDTDAGLARIGFQGATFNTADEILAALGTPLEMIANKTWNPAEGYRYGKAKQDLSLEEGRKAAGWAGTAADVAGGFMTGSTLARGGVTVARMLAPNASLAARSVASAADAGLMGAAAGAADGNSLEERGSNALMGGATGAALGGVAPGVIRAGQAALSPVTSNIRARVNPEGYARSQVARSMMEGNVSPANIADDVAMASREGQGVYTVADAMGNPGQRMLSTVARAPGAGRTNTVDFLESRQAGQGRRVANTLAEGFDSPQTAAQSTNRLTAARDAASDIAYPAARQGAGPVDLSRAITAVDDTLQPGVNQIARPQSGIANDSIEGALEGFRNRLTDGRSVLTDYTAVERVRGDISDAVQRAVRAGEGNKARLLGGLLREVDNAMESASPGFRAANAQHTAGSRVIDSVDEGRTAAMRGRTEDTIPNFRARPAAQQDAFRTGYVDPLIEQAQGGAMGVNKARPLTSDAFRDEAAAIAPMRTQAQMQRKLGRENTMFETRAHALGGSKNADNLADQSAMGVDASMIANLMKGNWGGVARGALTAGQNALTGNTPAVREEVSRILLMRGGNVAPQQMQGILEEAINRITMRQMISGQLGRGVAGGLAVAPQYKNE